MPKYEAGEIAEQRSAGVDIQALDSILYAVREEFLRASGMHAKMHSHHEAYGVILEEVEEFWDECKIDDSAAARVELVQVAAMAVRALHDVPATFRTPKPGARPFSKKEKNALRLFLRMLHTMERNPEDIRAGTIEREAKEVFRTLYE
jgi:hypothetical protein